MTPFIKLHMLYNHSYILTYRLIDVKCYSLTYVRVNPQPIFGPKISWFTLVK